MLRTTAPHPYRPVRTLLLVLAGVAILALSGCANSTTVGQAASPAEISIPAEATEDSSYGQCPNRPATITLTNDSSTRVFLSVEGGPQNALVAAGASSTSTANSLRITRDGGYVLLQMSTIWDDDDCSLQPRDVIVFEATDGAGQPCFRETVGWVYPGTDPSKTATCSSRNVTLQYEATSNTPGNGKGNVILTGDNWN